MINTTILLKFWLVTKKNINIEVIIIAALLKNKIIKLKFVALQKIMPNF